MNQMLLVVFTLAAAGGTQDTVMQQRAFPESTRSVESDMRRFTVVGLELDASATRQLQAIATAGGGRYLGADSVGQLTAALVAAVTGDTMPRDTLVPPPPATPVRATRGLLVQPRGEVTGMQIVLLVFLIFSCASMLIVLVSLRRRRKMVRRR